MLFKSEKEMLNKFLEVIHPIDILSGWNSEFFDIPYIAKRIELVLGESAISRLSFENAPLPRWSEKERFKNAKSKDPVLIMQSRIHLDYMQLFRKFNLTPRQSYSLNAIGLDELNVPKIDYPGTLADLYNNDFELFLEYNIHDVRLVRDIDSKLKYINLANQMIHMASVNFDAIFGSVHLIDSAIITYAHNVLNVVVIDRQSRPDNEKVEGALVVTPKPGKYRYIGSVDLNSLYPNTIRSIGLSPEKIVGQFIDTELAWNCISRGFKGESLNDVVLKFTLDSDIGKIYELNVSEIVDLLKENKWSVSGYGTILDQGNGIGILPSVLGYWFKGRKELQAEKKKYSKLADQAKRDGDIIKYEEYQKLAEYYDMLQGVRKVLLNSTYGALLNAYMRFGDPRLGASTTYTGRQISTHMINTISSILTSDDNYNKIQKRIVETKKNKRTGEVEIIVENEYTIELNGTSGIVYGDTDSCYFTMEGLVNNIDESIELANGIADYVNSTFDNFMKTSFNCQDDYLGLIKVAREIVAHSGIFQAKKKYMLALADKEGKRVNQGDDDELKTMGSDIKLSSTPDIIKEFLKKIVMSILYDVPKEDINQMVIDFRNSLHCNDSINPLDIATIMNVKELDEYQMKWELIEHTGKGKVTIPAHVRAAINFNHFIKKNQFHFEQELISGNKVKVVWLKENPYNFNAIAFSSDEERFPEWFKQYFEPDIDLLEQKLVDQKLDNIFVALNWMVPTQQSMLMSSLLDIDETRKEKKTKRKPKAETKTFGLEF
jgi:DNA polymerase elongation subunit (family B)